MVFGSFNYLLLSILIGYSFGNINPSFAFAKRKGYDARVDGSGSAGASNALILAGKKAFVISALLDIAKSFWACRICRRLFPGLIVLELVGGVACILGHMFPVLLRFRGGKGLACLGGVALSWNWKIFLVLFLLAILIAFVTNYVCFVAPFMSAVFPGLYYWKERSLAGVLILMIPIIPIFLKHRVNFQRILNGTEARFSYLWNKDEELKRLGR